MIRPKVETLARPDVVNSRHPEFGMTFVDPVQRLTEVGVLFADGRDRVFPVPTDHVGVQVGHDLVDRHGCVLGEVFAAPQSFFFAADENKHQRAAGPGMQGRERFGGFHHRDRSGGIVVCAVVDAVAGRRIGIPYADMIHVAAEHDVLVTQHGIASLEHGDHVGSRRRLDGFILHFDRKGEIR